MRKSGTVNSADFPQPAPNKCSEHQRKDQHKTALVLPSSTCTTPQPALASQKWPARTGDATSPPVADDCVREHPKILNQPDLHMTMVPQPPPQHSPQVGVFAFALRCKPLSPLRKPRTWWSVLKRKGGTARDGATKTAHSSLWACFECSQRGAHAALPWCCHPRLASRHQPAHARFWSHLL